MRVKDLIAVLLECPDPDREVWIRVNWREAGAMCWVHLPLTDLDSDRGTVVIDTEEMDERNPVTH